MSQTLEYLMRRFDIASQEKACIKVKNINRVIMAEILAELGFRLGVEVGVAEGLHAEVLCQKNPLCLIYGIDAYQKYPGYEEYKDPLQCFVEAQKRVEGKKFEFINQFSMDAVKNFPDNSLDFVFIDGGHDFKNIAMDIVEWSKKVKVGGIVYGHDYKRTGKHSKNKVDVKDVVDAYMYAMGIQPWFVLLDDIKNEYFGQDNPCWLYIKK